MMINIVRSIICSQFETTFGRGSQAAKDANRMSDPNHAMQVKFSLNPDYKVEEGYRHLTLLIFGGGCNYIGVYAKLGWNVVSKDDLSDDDSLKPGGKYVEGETPWVLLGYHDSCWRSAIESLTWNYQERINSIDYLFNGKTGWYKSVLLSKEEQSALEDIRRSTPGYGNERGERVTLGSLEFKF